MKNMFNTDKYTKLEYNRNTGKMDREWIRYADNTYEPVRRDGNIHRKYHSPNRMTDWWLTRKPQDWHPSDEGADASLNHDYGEHDKPGAKAKQPSTRHNFGLRKEDIGRGATLFAQPAAAEKGDGSSKPAAPKTSLGKGAGAIRELEEKEKSQGTVKPRNSAQDARDLKDWEKKHRYKSDHEKRPPSASRDANILEDKVRHSNGMYDLFNWKYHPEWGASESAARKVQQVTHPIGTELGVRAARDVLKGAGLAGKIAGKALGAGAFFLDYLDVDDKAW